MITFDDIRKGDTITFRGHNGVTYTCRAIHETVGGWMVRHREPSSWQACVTSDRFIRARRPRTHHG